MAIGRITYANKVDYRQEGQDDKYKITAENMNEIKRVFNNSAEAIEKGLSTIDENVKKTNDARDLAKQYMEQASQDALAINGTANGIIEKVTTEDGYAQINDSSNRRLNNMIIRGNSEQIQTTGKNLFDISKINSESNPTSTGIINSVIDGVINAQWNTSYQSAEIGSSNYSSGWINTYNNSIELQPNTYTLSFKHKVIKKLTTIDNLGNFRTMVGKGENNAITDVYFTGDFNNFKSISTTFTLVATESINLMFTCNNCQIEIKDIQLEVGSTATSYEPHTGGKPSPSPEYPQEVKGMDKIEGKVVGKNLVSDTNFDKYYKYSNDGYYGRIENQYHAKDIFYNIQSLEQTKKYKLSFEAMIPNDSNINSISAYFKYEDNTKENSKTINTKGVYNKYELMSNGKKIIECGVDYGTGGIIAFKKIPLLIDVSYQKEQSFNYTLSKPLYRLSDSVYDYIDIDRGKIIRNIGVITFDGSDDEEISKVSNTNINVYQFNNAINSIEKYTKYSKCDSFQVATSYNNDLLINDNKIYTATISCYLSFDKMDTVEKLRTYLQQNPVTVYYQLATPTEEDIPAELLSQLKELQTYVTTTNVMFEASDVYPIVDLEYIADTKTYIDNKFKELAEVIITSTSEEEL